MKKILVLGFVALGATAFASSNTFKLHIYQDSVVEGKTLKAGDYKLSMENGNAVISQGKKSIEVPAREETAPKKAESTELNYVNNTNLQAINMGGSHTRIVFEGSIPAHSGM
ncbi:MAG TPA: hypothetical protein VG168_03235 [Bryobacteraceae bacterium]|jgi:hypothetical protein|nr:hypothetical protein [Bryobacteraceae bacterium]